MSDILQKLNIAPGTVKHFVHRVLGTEIDIPATFMRGMEEGPFLLVSSGVHGSEYPGILASIELGGELEPGALRGSLLMLHLVNAGAFKERIAFNLPSDGKNLNRMFPGDPAGGDSEKTAWLLTGLQEMADFYLDLHSGDLFEDLTPFVYFPGKGEEVVINASMDAARVLDVPYMVRSLATTGAYNSAALRGTPSLLLERGCSGKCTREEVELYKRDLLNVMRHLGMLPGAVERECQPVKELTSVVYLMAKRDACWQALVRPGQEVHKGQKLGESFDFFGGSREEFFAEQDGVVLYMLYTLSARVDDVLVAYGQ